LCFKIISDGELGIALDRSLATYNNTSTHIGQTYRVVSFANTN
jgi:hypothetical protein